MLQWYRITSLLIIARCTLKSGRSLRGSVDSLDGWDAIASSAPTRQPALVDPRSHAPSRDADMGIAQLLQQLQRQYRPETQPHHQSRHAHVDVDDPSGLEAFTLDTRPPSHRINKPTRQSVSSGGMTAVPPPSFMQHPTRIDRYTHPSLASHSINNADVQGTTSMHAMWGVQSRSNAPYKYRPRLLH